MSRPRVVVLRGHNANPWELGAWAHLSDRFEVVVVVTGSSHYDVGAIPVDRVEVRALRDRLPRGRLGDLIALGLGDRYLGLEEALRGADIVHGAEIGVPWSSAPAALRRRLGFRLVLTIWETIPFLATYRGFRGRRDRVRTLAETDLFLAATERAATALRVEGAPPERILVAAPGIDATRFGVAPAVATADHLIVSPGRLVWEKGHFDVLRAVALLESRPRVEIVGSGPEAARLRRYADELGLADRVTIHSVPYEAMPGVLARASCVVLASLPIPLWEEQFGMVLAEAMTAGVPIVASASGAIPEVLAGSGAALFRPGDWPELARLLREGPLSGPPIARAAYPADVVGRYASTAAAERLAAAYERVLGG